MKYLKATASLFTLSLMMFFFQNQVASHIVLFKINPNDLVSSNVRNFTYKPSMDEHVGPILDLNSGKSHEAKFQGIGFPPKSVKARNTNNSYIEFEIKGSRTSIKNDRSEIRVVGTDSEFGEYYYSGFEFKLPRMPSGSGQILNDGQANAVENDWALIWQCAQIDGSGGANSPPLSLQITNDVLAVKTIQDYQPWSNGNPKPDIQNISQIERDRWYKVLIRYKLGSQGSYAVWLDGMRVNTLTRFNGSNLVDTKYLPIGYRNVTNNSRQYCSVRYGLYKNPAPGHYIVQFKDFSFGNVYHRLQDL